MNAGRAWDHTMRPRTKQLSRFTSGFDAVSPSIWNLYRSSGQVELPPKLPHRTRQNVDIITIKGINIFLEDAVSDTGDYDAITCQLQAEIERLWIAYQNA